MEDTQELDASEGELEDMLPPTATQGAKAWGRLASLDVHQYPDIVLENFEEIIGRQHCNNNPNVSRKHCRIVRSASMEGALVDDWSSTVLQVNGSQVAKGSQLKLSDKDTITLGKAEKGYPQYRFLILDTKKRSREEASQSSLQPASSGRASSVQTGQDGGQSSMNASPLKKMKGIELNNNEKFKKFECGICHEILHNSTSTIPCLHTFCAACLSRWVKKNPTCPKCRANLTAVKKNCDMNAFVEDLLKEHPEKQQRSPEDLAREDKDNLFHTDPFPLPIGQEVPLPIVHGGQELDREDDDSDAAGSEESDEDQARCPQCPPAQRGGFTCSTPQAHISCSACDQRMPDLGLPTQKCAWCQRVGCHLYFRSLPAPRTGLPDGCTAPEEERLEKLNEKVWARLPESTFRWEHPQLGPIIYQVEQENLCRYLLDNQLRVQDAVEEVLEKVQSGEWDMPHEHIHPVSAPGFPLPGNLRHDSPLCGNCADAVIGGLLYKYRESIPEEELPADARNKIDCWYGWQCRRQRVKDDLTRAHAEKLNHVCPNTRHGAGH